MSAHRGALSGSCAVGIRSSRATSQGIEVAQRKHREQPTRAALTDAISVDRADRHGAMVGYASADADQRARANDELRRQVEEIAAECERRGLRLLEVVRERDRQHRRPLSGLGLGTRSNRSRLETPAVSLSQTFPASLILCLTLVECWSG